MKNHPMTKRRLLTSVIDEESLAELSPIKFQHWVRRALHLSSSCPIQTKQKGKANWLDINSFGSKLKTNQTTLGYFVSFSFTDDAVREIRKLNKKREVEIVPLTIKKLLIQLRKN